MSVEQKEAVQVEAPNAGFFARQRPSVTSRVAFWASIVGFLGSLGGAIAITIGTGAPSHDIVTTTICWFVIALLLATRFRWATLVAGLVAVYNLYLVSVEPYAIESFANPKGPNGGYGHFVGDVVALALALLVLGCCIGLTVRNYRGGSRQSSRS